jgi:hypothetical protein
VLLLMSITKERAIRRPRPVFSYPVETINAPQMGYSALSEKPPSSHLIDSDRETSPGAIARVIPNNPRADAGSGSRIGATTTPIKRAKSCQAGATRLTGCGNEARTSQARRWAANLQDVLIASPDPPGGFWIGEAFGSRSYGREKVARQVTIS